MKSQTQSRNRKRSEVLLECGSSFSEAADEILKKCAALASEERCIVYVQDDDMQLILMESALHFASHHLEIKIVSRMEHEWIETFMKKSSKKEKRAWKLDVRFLFEPYDFILSFMDESTRMEIEKEKHRIRGFWADPNRRRIQIVVDAGVPSGTYEFILPPKE